MFRTLQQKVENMLNCWYDTKSKGGLVDDRLVWSEKKKNVHYVNEEFFTKWSPNMAYVLGFFSADGCLSINQKRNNKYIEFVSTDYEIIEKIKSTLESEHKITARKRDENWHVSYRIQIGSKKIFNSLIDLGFMPNKSKILKFPTVPTCYLPHFIRGYFDGDGHCTYGKYQRKNRPSKTKIIVSGFTSGSKEFIEKLQNILKEHAKIEGGLLSFRSNAYRLTYSLTNSRKLFNFLYSDIEQSLYLSRKYIKFNQALKMWGRSSVEEQLPVTQ